VETGLYYHRFRYYHPESGLYLSQDPIKLEGNNPNFYAYVHDSNAWVDPFGLSKSECSVKIKETQKASLPEEMIKSFEGGIYKTGILEEDLIVYRSFGVNAKLRGNLKLL
jgi:uncharacterized protein RhaS with RHS repeats